MCTAHANGDLVLRMLPECGQKESLEASLGEAVVGTVSSDIHASIVVSAEGSISSQAAGCQVPAERLRPS